MTSLPRRKIVIYLVLIFVAGGISGAAINSEFPHRGRARGFPSADRLLQHLQHELDLTPDQSKKIQPILDQMVSDFKTINKEGVHKTCAAMHSRNQEITQILTPSQAEKLQIIEHEKIERLQRSTR